MYFPNPFKFKGMQPKALRTGPRPVLAWWAFLLATLLWAFRWKSGVLAGNLQKTGRFSRSLGPAFHWHLLYHAARDLLSFLTLTYPKTIYLARGSANALTAMQSGPCLFLTAHLHHFEALGAYLSAQGVPLIAVARPMSRPFAQAWLARLRQRMGLRILWSERPKRPSASVETIRRPLAKKPASSLWLREGLHHLDRGGCLAMLWDQKPPSAHGVPGRFFGQPVLCDPLPLFVLRRRELPVFAGLLAPNGEVRLIRIDGKAAASRAERLEKTLSGGQPQAGDRLLARYHRWLEAVSRNYPRHAYWLLHRRFDSWA